MSRFLLIGMSILLLGIPSATAVTIQASWDPVTLDIENNPETISHYILYYGTTPRPNDVIHPSDTQFQYQHSRNVGNTTQVQQTDLVAGQTYYFAVVAVDIGGNVSNYSEQIQFSVPAGDGGVVSDGGGEFDGGGKLSDAGGSVGVEGGCGCAVGSFSSAAWFSFFILLFLLRKRPGSI